MEVKEGAQAVEARGDLWSSAAPDLRLGLPLPVDGGSCRESGSDVPRGLWEQRAVRIADRPARMSE